MTRNPVEIITQNEMPRNPEPAELLISGRHTNHTSGVIPIGFGVDLPSDSARETLDNPKQRATTKWPPSKRSSSDA